MILEKARCHKTEKASQFCFANYILLIFIPPRMTNLLHPADVCWFGSIKKARWVYWFTYEERTYTGNQNARSAGYAVCIDWLSELWSQFSPALIKKSFSLCGIVKHLVDEDNLKIDTASLHSELRQMLTKQDIFNDFVDVDLELAEAVDYANENDPFIFEDQEVVEPISDDILLNAEESEEDDEDKKRT